MIDFEVILEKLGLGTYQIALLLFLGYHGFPSGLNVIGPVFLSYTPQYR